MKGKANVQILNSVTIKVLCGCGDIYVTFMQGGDKVTRIDVHGGKWGTCLAVNMLSNQSLINEMLKNGYNPDKEGNVPTSIDALNKIIDIINNTHCFRMRKQTDRWVYSCVDAISHAIQLFIKEFQSEKGQFITEEKKS